MYVLCYGTRPEIIKMSPLIRAFEANNIPFVTLFSGQHPDLFEQCTELIPEPTFILENIMEHNQTLNQLSSKIIHKMDAILQQHQHIDSIIVQGDTTTAYSIALAGFHCKKQIIHLEAGLRSHIKYSPFPEEIGRSLLSRIADIHLCPTKQAVLNLRAEGIRKNIYLVGNTIVDAFAHIITTYTIPDPIHTIIDSISLQKYYIVTLHRRENRGKLMKEMWDQLNSVSNTYTFVYITHPSLPEASTYLHESIIKIPPQDYISMVFLIHHSSGIITDSGGLQEEAVCSKKKVLICRDTTERPETITSGWGKLIHTDIINNIHFLTNVSTIDTQKENPYGKQVCDKIINIVKNNI